MTEISERFHPNTPKFSPMGRFGTDMMNRELAYIYKYTKTTNSLNEPVETFAAIPYTSLGCFQEHSSDNQEQVDPAVSSPHYANFWTRERNRFNWKDHVVVRGIKFEVLAAHEHNDNHTGQFSHTAVRLRYLDDTKRLTPL